MIWERWQVYPATSAIKDEHKFNPRDLPANGELVSALSAHKKRNPPELSPAPSLLDSRLDLELFDPHLPWS